MENTVQMKIKRVDASTLHHVVELFDNYRIFYKQPSDIKTAESFLKERLSHNESVIFLAYHEEGEAIHPIGFTQLYPRISSVMVKKNWHIGDLYTEQEYRKLGIGNELLKTAIAFAEKEDADLYP